MTKPEEGPPGGGLSLRLRSAEVTHGVSPTPAEGAAQATFEQRYREEVRENLRLRAVIAEAAERLDKAELTLSRLDLTSAMLSVAATCRVALGSGQ